MHRGRFYYHFSYPLLFNSTNRLASRNFAVIYKATLRDIIMTAVRNANTIKEIHL